MSDPRLNMTPNQVAELDAWIGEQAKHFGPGSMDTAVELMRGYRARRENAKDGAA